MIYTGNTVYNDGNESEIFLELSLITVAIDSE